MESWRRSIPSYNGSPTGQNNNSVNQQPQDPSAAILGAIYVVLVIHCYKPDLNKMSVWLVLPPYNDQDDYEQQ